MIKNLVHTHELFNYFFRLYFILKRVALYRIFLGTYVITWSIKTSLDLCDPLPNLVVQLFLSFTHVPSISFRRTSQLLQQTNE